ncbi:hypothetical protein [Deinococcus sp.]|uniref:hypothetical protein n=1 Tax=Deinococcus sp. TaxID=47478 RepID=UPI003CC6CA67
MKRLALALLLSAQIGTALAGAETATVRVQVADAPGLTFNHVARNTLTLTTPWGTQTAVFGGTPYSPDPQHYWNHLFPLTLNVRVPGGVGSGSYPLKASAQLFLCDQRAHLCTVKTAEASGDLNLSGSSARLELLLSVPTFKLSP